MRVFTLGRTNFDFSKTFFDFTLKPFYFKVRDFNDNYLLDYDYIIFINNIIENNLNSIRKQL